MLRPQFCDLGPEIESAHKKHGWLPADSISGPKSQNCVRNIFFYGSLFLLTEPKFHSCLTLTSNNSRRKPDTLNKSHNFWNRQDVRFHMDLAWILASLSRFREMSVL